MVNGSDRPPVRVLMVDDDLVDRRAVRRALGDAYVVTEAEDGRQARQSFDSAVPDCVLLDYNIPGTNTFELLDRFRQRAPVVMLTGQDDVEAAVAAMKAGAQDYLCKNEFTAESLDQAIHRSIDKADRQRKELEARDRLRSEYRSEKRRRRQLEASLQIARDIQQNLIPSRPPQIEGFDFCGVCLPIEETAGDFFDYVPMADGSLGIVVGDISGHGIGPALLTAETRAYLRALSRTNSDVGQVMTIVNRLLWDDVIGGRFATLFFARLDAATRTLTFASAGHPAYLIHRSGQATILDSQTPPLGMFEDLVVPTSNAVSLATDDVLLLASDGLFDTAAPDGTHLGRDYCIRLVAKHCESPVEKIVDELLHATREFAEGMPLGDDLTVVVAKVK
jgi:phosphoserine phosphatase RsbU/P